MKKLFLLFIFVSLQMSLSAQIRNVRADKNGLYHNSALWGEVFLNVFGEDKVSDWLDKGDNCVLIYRVDDIGKFISMERINGKNKPNISEQDIAEIADYINKSGILFPRCFEGNAGFGLLDDLFLQESVSQTSHFNGTGFPGSIRLLSNESVTTKKKLNYSSCLSNNTRSRPSVNCWYWTDV